MGAAHAPVKVRGSTKDLFHFIFIVHSTTEMFKQTLQKNDHDKSPHAYVLVHSLVLPFTGTASSIPQVQSQKTPNR